MHKLFTAGRTVNNNQSIDFLLLYFILAQMYVIVIVGVGCGVVLVAVVVFVYVSATKGAPSSSEVHPLF
jgi:hypothetical protein